VYRYDPGSDTWTQLASYPVPVAFAACAGIGGEIVCAGGANARNGGIGRPSKSTYVYSPGSNTWFQAANMPYTNIGMGYAGANGRLQVFSGLVNGVYSNQASQYDPASNKWSPLPNLNVPEALGGASCGLYAIGGLLPNTFFQSSWFSETLPGYDQCGPVHVPWLSAGQAGFTVSPGQSVTVPLTLDSSRVAQPGTYTAGLAVDAGTPSPVPPVTITLTVKPPRTWGEITGTVTDAATGDPIAGATVQVAAFGGHGQVSYTTTTDSSGRYQWWLDARYDPLLVSVADDGYQPQARAARIRPGTATTLNFALAANPNPAGDRR
jgi:hypothetical protein